jgi:Domain of unknown function (DUF4129)
MSRQRLWRIIGLGCAIVALLLLASGLSGLTFRAGHFFDLIARLLVPGGAGPAPRVDVASLSFWRALVSSVALVLLVTTVIGMIVSRKLRRELLRRVISMLIALGLFYLLLGILRANSDQRSPSTASAVRPAPLQGEPFPTFVANPSTWLIVVVSVILVALPLGAIWFFWRRMRAQESPLARLADEAQVALAELQSGIDLKDTVLRCYREMSRILSEQRGIARPRDMTPREFERQLAAVGLRDEHIQQLTRLFERVRYGPRQAGEREEREAIACLSAIAQMYGKVS